MKKTILGAVSACALLVGGVAGAGGDKQQDPESSTSSDMGSGTGGSGSAGQTQPSTGATGTTGGAQTATPPEGSSAGSSMSDPMAGQELTGRVVRAEQKTIYIEHMGAVVPLKVDKSTQFSAAGIKSAKDLKEGQEIRASFEVKDRTSNVAKSISLAETGQGGSGLESEEGMGGSGMESDPSLSNTPEEPATPMPAEPATPMPEEPGSEPSGTPTY